MAESAIYYLQGASENGDAIAAAARMIRSGGTVVFPTETVYGLGADATSDEAVRKIYEAKGRPSDNPLIVHLADTAQIPLWAKGFHEDAQALASLYMPGPLTLVLHKRPAISPLVTAGLDTVAIRVPSHAIAHSFLLESGLPVAAPSANLSTKPSLTSPKDVLDDMQGRADVLLLDGECEVGIESTVLDCTVRPFCILRPGAVSIEDIQRVAECVYSDGNASAPKAPGMKYRHYSPQAELVALDMGIEEAKAFFAGLGPGESEAAILAFDECLPAGRAKCISLGSAGDLRSGMQKLFSAFRDLDRRGIARAYVVCPPPTPAGMGMRNRILKAASRTIVG